MTASPPLQTTVLLDRLLEQDYFIFLSFFGWMLVGLLAWTKPLAERERASFPWLWFGYFGFSQAVAQFIRLLSFSDPFFRDFNVGTAFEMLGFGLLIEFALRCRSTYRNRGHLPYVALICVLLGLSIETNELLYSQVVAALVVLFASFWTAFLFFKESGKLNANGNITMAIGLVLVAPSWFLGIDRLAFLGVQSDPFYGELPRYGIPSVAINILSVWTILTGFWRQRLQGRIYDVEPSIGRQLQFWGYRVLPGALGFIVLLSFLITQSNGKRAKEEMNQSYLMRSQSAALVMAGLPLRDVLDNLLIQAQSYPDVLASRMLDIKSIGSDVVNVYAWAGDEEGIQTISDQENSKGVPFIESLREVLAGNASYLDGQSFLFGPVISNTTSVIHVSSPIIDSETGLPAYWLGVDLSANDWVVNVSRTRLQTIIIVGLVMALTLFFLYYQIDHESKADLALAKEKAEAADRAKSEFLAVISHEIRTPLQSVLGYSDLLRGTPLNDKQMSCLDTIQSEGKILLRIVQDILDFSNLRKASFELKDDHVQLKRLIDETFNTIRPMAEKKGLVAELKVDDAIPEVVVADSVRLRQVLLNLFGNSVKYTEKGRVSLSVLQGSVSDEDRPGAVDFIIEDSGIGIKKEDLGRLFEPFIQLENTGHFGREGAGLGLAIVNRIVELMGGSIQVESERGVGSKFVASFHFDRLLKTSDLGAIETARDPIEVEALYAFGQRFPLRILVADDNPMVRQLVAQYLDSLGYKADLVDGGGPASEKGLNYDLVIIDLRMPDIDGPQAVENIRSQSESDDHPWIIGVSATLAEAEIERARQSGINDFLGKPFFVEGLLERIKAIPHLEEFATDSSNNVVENPVQEENSEDRESVEVESSDSITGGGMGIFSPELVQNAVKEVYQLSEEMREAHESEDFAFIQEKAHYISNTAMALGIDSLYVDSKALQKSAEEERKSESMEILERLEKNFASWESNGS